MGRRITHVKHTVHEEDSQIEQIDLPLGRDKLSILGQRDLHVGMD
jgi:hypothetical protein